MSKPLENKLALVTGSSRGIGAAIAVRLAAEGAHVIVNYAASPARAEQVVSEITKAGGHAEAVQADLSTVEGTKALAASVDKVFGGKFGGRLDILVNNAGTVVFGPSSSPPKTLTTSTSSECALADRADQRHCSAHDQDRMGPHHQHWFLPW